MRESRNLTVETRALELFDTFAGFIKLMQRPDEYVALVSKTQKTLDEYRELLGPYAVKARADEYLADIKAYEIELEAKHAEAEKLFAEECAKKQVELDAQKTLNEEILEVTQKSYDAQVSATQWNKEESVRLNRYNTELERREQAMDKRHEKLEARDAELKQKAKQVQQLLG